jgi:cobalt-zinc-cadmium efflux system membrane fusion protein
MRTFLIATFLVFTWATAYSAEEKKVVSPGDYIGVSLEVPEATQKLIGLKMQKIESASTAEKIPVTGRISQDSEETSEVVSPQRGLLTEQMASIGSVVSKDQVLAKVNSIEIKSPASGVIIASYLKDGESVDTISPLYTIADLTKLPANFDVYEKDIGKVQRDQKVLVYSTAFPDQPFEGKITFISPRVDETSFTIKIRVLINNQDYLLKNGMFVRGEIVLEGKPGHFSVPSDAVQDLAGIKVVFIKDEATSFIPTEVKVHFSSRKQTSVEGDIKVGDLVVAEGAFILKSKIMEGEIAGGCADGH